MSPTAGCTVRVAPEQLFSAHEPAPVDELTVVTVNVQHAAPPRAGALAAWLSGPGGADVAVLTEVGHGSGRSALQSALAAHGYHTVSPPDCPDYSVVLAARGTEPQPVATTVEFLAHRAVAARLDFSGAAITVAGVYVPSRGPVARRNQDKRAFQSAFADALPRLAAAAGVQPLLVAGDLNVVEPQHQPHLPVFGNWEYAFYRSFATAGLEDAFRRLNPGAVEHSWFGRGGNGYRLDHMFVSAPHADRVAECRYLHSCRELSLTDHSALHAKILLR